MVRNLKPIGTFNFFIFTYELLVCSTYKLFQENVYIYIYIYIYIYNDVLFKRRKHKKMDVKDLRELIFKTYYKPTGFSKEHSYYLWKRYINIIPW